MRDRFPEKKKPPGGRGAARRCGSLAASPLPFGVARPFADHDRLETENWPPSLHCLSAWPGPQLAMHPGPGTV